MNLAVLDPSSFERRQPRALQSWHCVATRKRVEVVSRGYFDHVAHAYPREDFLVGGALPAPAP